MIVINIIKILHLSTVLILLVEAVVYFHEREKTSAKITKLKRFKS
jgi:hypothetical protein